MSLNKAQLIIDLTSAYNQAKTVETTEAQFAISIADAIDAFVKTGTVTTPIGVAVATPNTFVGTTTAPGIGVIS